jgi:GT2 family glycosyltransferase/peptidoglycan/xylan/chitin deacetylase (PgdA/CDA1 family)
MISHRSHIAFDVSIIVPTRNRHESMLRTVGTLLSQISYDAKVEIVIIEETNNPKPVNYRRVKYHAIPERGLGFGFARNLGMRNASGSIIVFIDDDIIPAENWFINLITPFEDNNVGAVGGTILPDLTEITDIGKVISFLGFPAGGLKRYLLAKNKHIETNLISTGNCAFRASLGREVGGFDPFLRWGGEDQDFFTQIASRSKTLFVPEAIAFHRQRDSLWSVFLWFVRRGKADFCVRCKKYHPLLSLLFPLRMNSWLKLLPFLAVLSGAFSLGFLEGFLFAVFAILIWNMVLWKRESRVLNQRPDDLPSIVEQVGRAITMKEVKRRLVLVKTTMDLGQEIGILIGFLRYLRHRIVAKPFVLTFHHVNGNAKTMDSATSRYYVTAEHFRRILRECEREGRLIISLSKMIDRLRNNPSSLYFDKIIAITFDDAYLSIYDLVAEIAEERNYPFTVFLPTGLAGKINDWDDEKSSGKAKVMGWHEIKQLKTLGAEIGSHTRHHPHLLSLPFEAQIEEIKGSMVDLKANLSPHQDKAFVFSYPFGEYDLRTIEIVKESGFIGAVANFKGNIRPQTDPWQIPRFTVSGNSDWKSISLDSRMLWAKELAKDVFGWLTKVYANGHPL